MATRKEEERFKDQWYLDSGCSSHMTGRKDWSINISTLLKNKVDSLGGNKYFVTFIDGYNRKLWTYLIKKKSDVVDVFTKSKAMVERQGGHKIKVEVMSTATYIINKCPTKRLEGITPEECWSGVKPSLSHLKVFGSIARRHVPDQLRRKLDDKSSQMILVEYHSTGGYKLFDTVNKQVVINRDMIIYELKE
ncbi:hypothetical protein KIW84_013951 [Lathyrus oleraceus]|uniref:Uncharacterized protein n=1 Tax=Pisum sativum TaxID=3888 RepID=A0A9D5BLP0_PEA|nr:hypothetical protein KIW84_013951 [Pisum sativum]